MLEFSIDKIKYKFKILNMIIQKSNTNSTLRTPEEVREELAVRGISVSDWARQMGYSPGLVHQVLSGRLRCVRGQAHKVAVSLGLKAGLLGNVNDLPFVELPNQKQKS